MYKKLAFTSVFLLVFTATAVLAGNYGEFDMAVKQVILGADEEIDRDYFAAGEMVEISGTVNGDVYAAGGEVLVDGTGNGDLLVAGGNVTISGKIEQDLRVAGGNVTISGEIGRNVTAVGGNVVITNSSKLVGNLVTAGGNIRIAAPVAGNIKMAGGTAILSNEVGGFVHARVDMLRLTSKASVGDSLIYWSYQEASVDEGTQITGEVTHHTVKRPELPREDLLKVFAGLKAFTKLISLITALAIGLLAISFFPKFSQGATDVIQKRPWIAFGVGLLFLITVPVVFGLLLTLVIGIKLAFILLAGYFMMVAVSSVFTMLLAGYWFLRMFTKDIKPGMAMLVGAIIYYLLTMIPVLGNVVIIVALLFGLGGVLVAKKELYKELRNHKLI